MTQTRLWLTRWAAALMLIACPVGGWASGSPDGTCDPIADSYRACSGVADPDCYLNISLGGRRPKDLLGPEVALDSIWEVVPRNGSVEVAFDLDEMKDCWDFDTEASLSMWARKVPRPDPDDGAGTPIEIGIPPYSSLVEGLQVRGLDLAAAGDLVNQMSEGSRLAHRIRSFDSAAQLARLEAQRAGLKALKKAYLAYLVAAEEALTQLYTESLRFRLDVPHVERAAGILTEADTAVAEAKAKLTAAALDAAANKAFFDKLQTQRALIDGWLTGLQSDAVQPYMPVLAGLIERPSNVINGAVAKVTALLSSVDAEDADETARSAARGGLVAIAESLIDIETDLHVYYREVDDFTSYEDRRQYKDRKQKDFTQEQIEAIDPFFLRVRKALKAEETTVTCSKDGRVDDKAALEPFSQDDDSDDEKAKDPVGGQAQARFDALEPFLEWIRGGKLPKSISETIKERFESQIERLREPVEKLDNDIDKLGDKIAKRKHDADQVGRALAQCGTHRDRVSTTVTTLLMIDVMDRLIDKIVPGSLSLESADLDSGDRLEIMISFSKPVAAGKLPPAQSYSFVASPFGWRAPLPYITDATSYAKAEGSNDYEFKPGLLAVWNYYGRAKKRKSAWRTVAPGFGIHAIALQFSEEMDADDEFGIGVGVTLFDNLLTFSGGWNLQAKDGDSRTYFAVGLSVRRAMEKAFNQ